MNVIVLFLLLMGSINLILAILFLYYAVINYSKLKGAVSQRFILSGALFFVITGFSNAFYSSTPTISLSVSYFSFILGFFLICAGEVHLNRTIHYVVSVTGEMTLPRASSQKRYRFLALSVISFIAIPLATLTSISGPFSSYGIVSSSITSLSLLLLIIGEREVHIATNIFSKTGTTAINPEEIELLRDDIVAAGIYSDIINTFLTIVKQFISEDLLENTLNRWTAENPVLFEGCFAKGENRIDASLVIKNLDRLCETGRYEVVLRVFSVLINRLIDPYRDITTTEHANKLLEQSFRATKRQYGDSHIIYDILRSLPDGILEVEKLSLLSRNELELKVKKRTSQLEETLNELKITSLELSKEKAYTENILTSMADSLIVVGTGGKILEANKATFDLLNYDYGQLIGKPIESILLLKGEFDCDKRNRLLLFEEIFKEGCMDVEMGYKSSDGSIVPVSFSSSIMRDDLGDTVGFVCVAKDITERNQIKEALRESELRYRTIFETTGTASAIVNNNTTIELVNKGFEELSGYTKDELEDKMSWIEFLSEGDLEDIMESYKTRSIDYGEEPWSIEFGIIDRYGNVKEVFMTVSHIPGTDKNVASLLEITQRKRMEEELKRSEDKFHLLFETSPDVVVMLDTKGRLVDVNSAVYTIFGYDREEIIGRYVEDLEFISKNYSKNLLENLARRVAGKYIPPYDVEVRTKGGGLRFVEIDANVIAKDGQINGLVVIARDITRRKQAEDEIAQKNEELKIMRDKLIELNIHLEQMVEERTSEIENLLRQKDAFVSQLGHDLKSPLTPLMVMLPMILDRESDPELRNLVKTAIENATYMKNLVIKTLTLARLNSPNAELNMEDTDLYYDVNNLIKARRTVFESNCMEIENNVKVETIVRADKLRLEELFDNLLTNAIKYRNGDSGKLMIDVENGDNGFVTVSVKDTGIGMDSEELKRAFDEFYKVDDSRHDLNSSGLGLTICKRIVERHGGKIWAESPGKGKGTTFYFTLQSGEA
ncbi:MAG: PAS domain-containing sensor histidine kinase [Halobacteriota archaeon]|nr:PAS domain-containing sensor histidine kinase [Halobacteriota archaeon]